MSDTIDRTAPREDGENQNLAPKPMRKNPIPRKLVMGLSVVCVRPGRMGVISRVGAPPSAASLGAIRLVVSYSGLAYGKFRLPDFRS